MSKKNLLYIILIPILFGVGSYLWKATNVNRRFNEIDEKDPKKLNSIVILVGKTPIKQAEVDFEKTMQIKGIEQGLADDSMSAIPETNRPLNKVLSSLNLRTAANIIERKLLYLYLQRDATFDSKDPKRLEKCEKAYEEAKSTFGEESKDAQFDKYLKNMLCEHSVINQYLSEKIFNQISVTEADIEKYYKANPAKFKYPERVIIRQILFSSEEEARKMRNKVTRENFINYARELSIAPERDQGGRLGPFSQGEMPEIFNIAFLMRPGEIRGVLKSTYGFHLMMLERKIPASQLSLAEARSQIRTLLLDEKRQESYKIWVEQALTAIPISAPKSLW